MIVGVLAILFLLIINFSLKANGVIDIDTFFTNVTALENTTYVVQIVTAFCVVIGAVIGIWQYVLTARAERAKLNTDCIQKAIDLAEYYKDNILQNYKMIRYVFDETRMSDIIQEINKNELRNFDEIELEMLMPKAQRKKLDNIKKSEEFVRAVVRADKIYEMNLNIEHDTSAAEDDESKGAVSCIDNNAVSRKFMGRIVTDTLNNLEYFSMNFTHGTADESVVYQSLHQTFLEIVYMLYYNIAISNKLNKSKYYTNIIELYDKWNKRSLDDAGKRSASLRSVTTKGNVVDRY